MSYLIFDGVNDEAVSASVVTRNLGNHRYTIKGVYRGDNGYFASMWNQRGFQFRGDRMRVYYDGGNSSNFTHTSNVLTSGDTFEYVITVTETSPGSGVNAHSVTLEINDSGSPIACSGTLNVADSNMQADAQIVLGRRGPDSVYCLVDIERFCYEDLDNASKNVDLNANLTNRTTGTPVLEDQVGSNHATGAGMPTDGSAWSDLSGASGTEQPLTLEQAQQLNESILLSIGQFASLTLETTQQTNQSNTLDLTQVIAQTLTLETTRQTNETNTLSASQQQLLGSILSEQLNQSNWAAIHSAQAVILAAVEQRNESSTIDINQSDGQLIALVQVEQVNQSSTLLVTQLGSIESLASEQLNESSVITLSASLSLESIASEQINQTNLLNILTSGDNTDLSGLTLVPVTSVFTLIETKAKYTLTEQ